MHRLTLALALLAGSLLAVPHFGSVSARAGSKKDVKQKPRKKKKKLKLPVTWERPFDISLVAGQLRVAAQGNGRYLVYLPYSVQRHLPKGYPRGATLFYSKDGKRFYANYNGRAASGKRAWSMDFFDGRHPENGHRGWTSRVDTQDDGATLTVHCDSRKAVFKELAPRKAAAVVKKAKFFDRLWNRFPQLLARDDHGVYYYVDNAVKPTHSRDFRVWIGMQGKMKFFPLKGVADDSGGQIFATKTGSLRLVMSQRGQLPKSAEWIEGDNRQSLLLLNLWSNKKMIYQELGPYLGYRLGTPCDDQ